MRALIALAGLCLTLGGAAQPPAKAFSIVIQGKYARRWVSIYREGDEWICATESNPYFPAEDDPLFDFSWKKMPKGASASGCRDAVAIQDKRTSKVRSTAGCLTDPAFKELVAKLDQRCRGE